jgi:hypothetical protein
MPGAGRNPWPPCNKKARGRNHRFSRIIRHSLRDGFNAYNALSLGTGLSCPHRPRDHLSQAWPQRREARTTRLCVRIGAVRPHDNRARRQRVHRIPRSTCRDDRPKRPSRRGGMARGKHNFPKNGRRIFLPRGVDGRITLESPREFFDLLRTGFGESRGAATGMNR